MALEFLLVDYLFLATIFGAGIKIFKTLSNKSYKDSFLVSGGKDGGGGGYSPPAAPDPAATAAAQATADRKTAKTNALLLNPTIRSPYGSVEYDVGNYTIDGDNVQRPTQTIKLSPDQQQVLDYRTQISKYLGSAGVGLAQNMPSTPFASSSNAPPRLSNIDYSGVDKTPSLSEFDDRRKAAEDSVYNRGLRLVQPDLDQQRKGIEERLVQSGNPLGSEAYNTEMSRYQRGRDETLQNLADKSVLAGSDEQHRGFTDAIQRQQLQLADAQRPYQTSQQLRGDALTEEQTLRNQQINELSALLQGSSAIQSPSSPGYNQSGLRSPDVAGITQANYNNQLSAYNTAYQNNQNQSSAFNSGLFGIGAAIARPAASAYFGSYI